MSIIKESHRAEFMPENIGVKCCECKEYIDMQKTMYQVFIVREHDGNALDFCSLKCMFRWLKDQ